MELTAAQSRIVEQRAGPLRVAGRPGCGKTTALVRRYLRLVEGGVRPSSVLVVAHDRAAATRFRHTVLPSLSGGFDALPITTWFGVAFDLVTRARGPVRLLSTSEQRALVRRLLAGESPADWPEYGHYLGRATFADEVAGALLRPAPAGCPELDRFARRYDAVLAERHEVDRSRLITQAAAVAQPGRYAHVLVDDHDVAMNGLLAAVAGDAVVVSEEPLPWPADDVVLDEPFRRPAAGVLIICRHPSTEAEAVAGELLVARSEGVAWSAMAVLVGNASRHGRSVARALSRHGIPVAPGPGLGAGAGDPAVAAIIDVLRWTAGDEGALGRLLVSPVSVLGDDGLAALRADIAARAPAATPAELAFTVWERGLGHLVTADDASLDAVVAFLDRLERRAEHDPSERLAGLLAGIDDGDVTPDPWRTPAGAGDGEAVTVTSIAGAAGREWHTVVVAGCVEGVLPRLRGRAPLFDPAPATPAEARQASLAEERRRFRAACSRATNRLVATAAPEPGVLLSRFVEDWPRQDEKAPAFRGPAPSARQATANPVDVFPGGELRLSASQLSTYVDCPLRYAYHYGLRVKEDAGPAMLLGTLTHAVLAEFLRPDREGEHSRDALLAIAVDLWRDDIARYRPQIEECRRDYYAMLELWWDVEGQHLDRRQVLKVEHEFDIQVGDVRLVGAIDRIDRTADGIRIIDYKTGRTEPPRHSLPDDLQLAVYHLAATQDPELAAFGPPRQLQLLYLRTMHALEQPILAGHAEATAARVLAAADDIRHERFEPSVAAACRNCSFHRLCPLQREGRQVGSAVSFDPTPEQREAIEAEASPQLLVAGAGTGKTTVMARRILHLVTSGQARPDQVLGLTFTNKAAAHLKAKVREELGSDADVTVGTYHSFGASVVADHALELDLHPDTRILNRAQAWQLLYGVFDEFRFQRRKTMQPQGLLDYALALASRCADHLVPIEAVAEDCERIIAGTATQKIRDTALMRLELCQVVEAYGRRKRERHLLDFGDQISLAVRLLTERPEVAAALHDQHPAVLLDEYQDTNFAQRRLLQLIYPRGSWVTAVGDDMQSIYGFRGAHLANILDFGTHFPPVTVRPLQTTFRFGPRLVALANRIQAKVEESLPKELSVPASAPDTTIDCFLAADDAEEAATIAGDIAKRVADGEPCGGTAVLCRKRRLIPSIVAALEEQRVAVEVIGASGLLDRPEVVDLVAWLQLVADDGATVALLRILEGPRYRISLRDLAAVSRHARGAEIGWLAALADLDSIPDLSDAARRRLGGFTVERATLAGAATRMPVLELAETIVERTGLWRASGELGRENLLRFLDLAEGFTPVEGDTGLRAFVEYLQLLDESDDDLAEAHLTDADAVKVMTIHQAKGLEFDAVYVPGLSGKGSSKIFPDGRSGENALTNGAALPWWLREDDGIPPWPGSKQKDIEEVIRRRRLDEEWRLLYVACTRAKRRLVCSAAHWYPGPAEPQGPSEFYDFVAGQADLVTEWFRHQPAEVNPDVAAKERQRAEAHRFADGTYAGLVAPRPAAAPTQLRLEAVIDAGVPAAARVAPPALSVTGLVTYARCPKQFFWTVVRPLPRRSSAAARLGTEIHRWIEQRAGRQLTLIEPEPDDTDDGLDPDRLPAGADLRGGLRASFLASPWAELDPVRVEAPFVLAVGGHLVRGRIDAAYERDGRTELVDFKTGRPAAEDDRAAATQLDLYGLAAVDAWGADPAGLRTTYCYLRADGPALIVSTDWDAGRVAGVRARLAATLDAMTEARFGPAPGSWCRRCDFLSFCPAGQAQVDGGEG